MRQLTIRNVPADLARRLEEESRASGRSLNQTVLYLLSEAVGLRRARRSNGLARLAGTWNVEEHDTFERALAPMEQIDEALWR